MELLEMKVDRRLIVTKHGRSARAAVLFRVYVGTLCRALRWKFREYSSLAEDPKELSANAASVIFIYSMDCTFFHDVNLCAHSNLIRKNGHGNLECLWGLCTLESISSCIFTSIQSQ